ncbi:Neuropeptide-like protein 46 [Meloidogyne graminicola]|uniref:Neuropeptide-like protein 46 n=1 Tax=Meloidogyne graminicola TaxID=189291 RepID=A0A8S9ZIX0_9BILA|nr:Neuropeptide-like protein 46 [Meloidogyne graminicola]
MFYKKRLLVGIGLLMVFSLSKCDFGYLKNYLNSRQWQELENHFNNYNRHNIPERINKLRWNNFLIDPTQFGLETFKRNIAIGRGDGFRPG